MLKIENYEVPSPWQWEMAVCGMRNPMNSWDRMDSAVEPYIHGTYQECFFNFGKNDHDLAMRLAAGGPVHAKYLRMLPVWVDILAPLYWWKECDTYKIGTVANSCSTMHKIQERVFTLEDFSCEHFNDLDSKRLDIHKDDLYRSEMRWGLEVIIHLLNKARDRFIETNDKRYWWQMIQLLPSSYNQKRTVMLNYQVLHDIYRDRRNHKLDEWHVFCDWIRELPYSELIVGEDSEE